MAESRRRQELNELGRQTVEVGAQNFEHILQALMERTGNNPQVATVIKEFLSALSIETEYGYSDEQLSDSQTEKITTRLEYVTNSFRASHGSSGHLKRAIAFLQNQQRRNGSG